MLPNHQGSIRLFRFAGIDVFLHWSWFIVAVYMIQSRTGEYGSYLWNALEYLALFAIVLVHEFGHSLACRQVGGRADQIVLWPLGGVAYVSPPARPGPTLWSIAAGPLVNVALLPVFTALLLAFRKLDPAGQWPNLQSFLWTLWLINVLLLCFNLLPVYPLDGGQILRALLWFVVGRGRSLMIATFFGFVGVLGLLALALLLRDLWIGLIAGFVLLSSWSGFRNSQMLLRLASLPRNPAFQCPDCGESPLDGPYWKCSACLQPYNPFDHGGVCPTCQSRPDALPCVSCGSAHAFPDWHPAPSRPI